MPSKVLIREADVCDRQKMIRSADFDIGTVRLIANCTGCLERTSSLPVGCTYVTMAIVLVNIDGNMLAAPILSDRVWTRSPLATILKAVSVFENQFNVLRLFAVTCQLTEPFMPLEPSVVAAVETLQLMCDSLIIGFQMARNWSVTVLAFFRYDMVCCSRTVRLGVFLNGGVLVKVFVGLVLFCCRGCSRTVQSSRLSHPLWITTVDPIKYASSSDIIILTRSWR